MKAITCSQCGALIKRFRIQDKFAECEYCHATIPVEKEKVIEIKEAKPKPVKIYQPNRELFQIEPETDKSTTLLGAILVFGGIACFIVLSFALLFYSITQPSRNERNQPAPVGQRTEPVLEDNYPTPSPLPSSTPLPNISYRTYVKYGTSIGAEHLELPTIEADQLDTFDLKILKKTVFREKRIRVRISINEDGEVTQAKALNGHQVLRDSSLRAAKQSLFSTRKNESKVILTYIFVLEENN